MGARAGPCGRGVGSLSYAGPCENGGSECKAKFFCKPSAKPWGGEAGARHRAECSCRGRRRLFSLPGVGFSIGAHRGGAQRREDLRGKPPQMLGAFAAARTCLLSPAPASHRLSLRVGLTVPGLRAPRLLRAAAPLQVWGCWG